MATRGRPIGTMGKTGGRAKGTLNKERRAEITGEIAFDILAVYQAMGGAAFLLDYAKAQPGAFIHQCLTRLMPAPQKDDPDEASSVSVQGWSALEAGRRVAFALAQAQHRLEDQQTIEPLPSLDTVRVTAPAPETPDPAREQWARDLQLTGEQAEEETRQTLETYGGSAAEQASRRRRLL